MWPALIAAGASIAGGLLGNKSARDEANRNREFQERMSNTSYQRAVEDMRAAGLSPMLAYSQGGASTPSGGQAQQSDVITPAVHSALSAYDRKLSTAQNEANVENTRADTANKVSSNELIRAQTASTMQQGNLASAQYNVSLETVNKIRAEVENLRTTNEQIQAATRKLMADEKLSYAQANKVAVEIVLGKAKVPGAQAEAARDASGYGQVRPYLDDIGRYGNSAADIVRKFVPLGKGGK